MEASQAQSQASILETDADVNKNNVETINERDLSKQKRDADEFSSMLSLFEKCKLSQNEASPISMLNDDAGGNRSCVETNGEISSSNQNRESDEFSSMLSLFEKCKLTQNEASPISMLNDDEILELFKYLDDPSLRKCREVCRHWRMLIESSFKLISRVAFHLKLGWETVFDIEQAPLSIMAKSESIKIKKLTLFEERLHDGSDPEFLSDQSLKKLVSIFGEKRLFESVTDLSIDSYENAHGKMFFDFMKRFTNLKSVNFADSVFAPLFKKFGKSFRTESVRSITLGFGRFYKENTIEDIQPIFESFPNTTDIHIKNELKLETIMKLVADFAPKIKSIYSKVNVQDMNDKNRLIELHEHSEIKNFDICVNAMVRKPNMDVFFDRPFHLITGLVLSNTRGKLFLKDLRFLRQLPNLQRLDLQYTYPHNYSDSVEPSEYFGHEPFEFLKLEEVNFDSPPIKCSECIETLYRSFKHIKKLSFKVSYPEYRQVENDLSSFLEYYKLEDIEISYKHFHSFHKKNLKHLGLSEYVPTNKIEDLDCPKSLESIKLSGKSLNKKQLLKNIIEYFPYIKNINLRDSDHTKIDKLNKVFTNGNGSCLQSLEISSNLRTNDILQIFRKLTHLQILEFERAEKLRIVIPRSVYYDIDVLKKYTFNEYIAPHVIRHEQYQRRIQKLLREQQQFEDFHNSFGEDFLNRI